MWTFILAVNWYDFKTEHCNAYIDKKIKLYGATHKEILGKNLSIQSHDQKNITNESQFWQVSFLSDPRGRLYQINSWKFPFPELELSIKLQYEEGGLYM